MEDKEKTSVNISPTITKLLNVIDTLIVKIKLIGFLDVLRNNNELELTDKLLDAQNIYRNLSRKYIPSWNFKPEEDEELFAQCDRLLHIIKTSDPGDWESMLNENCQLSGKVAELYETFVSLRFAIGAILTQTAAEWNEEEKYTKKYMKIAEINKALFTKLRAELPLVETAMTKMVNEKKNEIAEIDECIDRIERFAYGDIQFLRKSAKLTFDVIESKHAENMKVLEEERAKLQNKVDEARTISTNYHKKLKQRCEDLEHSVSWMVDHYDEKMTEIQKEFDITWNQFSKEMETCRATCQKFIPTHAEACASREQNRAEYEARIKLNLEIRRKMKAAIVIQKGWRALLEARKPKPDKKGKKKGKGKKK